MPEMLQEENRLPQVLTTKVQVRSIEDKLRPGAQSRNFATRVDSCCGELANKGLRQLRNRSVQTWGVWAKKIS